MPRTGNEKTKTRAGAKPAERTPLALSGAEWIAQMLKDCGITHVFYVESILRNTLVRLEALGIQGILAHSEKAAAYMADGYARASRGPGICMAQSVGALNIAAGLQDARLGHSPVLAITGRKPPLFQHRNAYQEIPHSSAFEAVTKFSAQVETADQLPLLFRQAFREATTGAPGPVHLELIGHQGQATESAQAPLVHRIDTRFMHIPALRPAPDPESVTAAASALSRAKRPVIVAGGGAVLSGAGPEIMELAEQKGIPVATSLNGKGVFPENHPLCAGVVGSYSRGCANRIVAEADMVLYVGSGTGDMTTHGWTVPGPDTPVIQIDIDPSELGRNYPDTTGLLGDAKTTLRALVNGLGAKASPPAWTRRARGLIQQWHSEMRPLTHSDAVPIRPERLCRELSAALPQHAVLVSDTGYSAVWSGILVPIAPPGQRYIRSAGSLGWGFPASLGIKCALPERPVVCFTGDGGFWYHLGELETARRCGIHTVTVINNNSGFGQCLAQTQGKKGFRNEMFRFGSVDFSKIAQAMDCTGIRVERPEAFAEAMQTALAADRPALIDVVTDVNCHPPEPWRP